MRRRWVGLALLGCLGLGAESGLVAESSSGAERSTGAERGLEGEAERPPNILMIVTDDQGKWTLGCEGNGDAETPNLDRLASQGVRMDQAFVATPVCSPSRMALVTGRYGSEFGVTDWIHPEEEKEVGIAAEAMTWPKRLAGVGYQTGLIGKWHLGGRERHRPERFGYGSFQGFLGGGVSTKNPVLEIDGSSAVRDGLAVELITDLAIGFLKQVGEAPWMLSVHYREPHAAYLPVSPGIWKRFENKKVTVEDYPGLDVPLVERRMREYLASVAGIDEQVGRLLAYVDGMKEVENTMVIFTSDHGYSLGHHGLEFKGNAHWRLKEVPESRWSGIPGAIRPNLYDTSLRVPLLIRWPKRIASGWVSSRVTTNLDWYPTLCACAGVETRSEVDGPLRGENFLPALCGEETEGRERRLYFEYAMHHGAKADMVAVRTSRWKWMRDRLHAGRVELYDLARDPEERVDLGDSEEASLREVRAELDRDVAEYFKHVAEGGRVLGEEGSPGR